MFFYVERKYKNNKITKNILSKYNKKDILYIDNYKNIFDKNMVVGSNNGIIIA
jgi:hypothetical protein